MSDPRRCPHCMDVHPPTMRCDPRILSQAWSRPNDFGARQADVTERAAIRIFEARRRKDQSA